MTRGTSIQTGEQLGKMGSVGISRNTLRLVRYSERLYLRVTQDEVRVLSPVLRVIPCIQVGVRVERGSRGWW